MASPLRKRATYQDLLRVSEGQVAEIVDGDLYASPRPAIPHSVSGSALNAVLTFPFQFGRGGPGGWWILVEPELHLAADVMVPDLAGWRRERLPKPPQAPAVELAPDWICELLSPSTETLDRARKLPAYLRHGVAHAWLVNPITRTLEVLRNEAGRWVLPGTHAGEAVVRAEPFDAVEVDLLLLWGEDRPPVAG